MKLLKITFVTVMLFAICCFDAAQAAVDHDQPAEDVHTVADKWVNQLSHLPEFTDWRDATLSYAALGPGTHGWIVSVKVDGEEIGYLVIHQNEEGGYVLSEYGMGTYPLFSKVRLKQYFAQQERPEDRIDPDRLSEASMLYFSPFEAVWEIADAHQTVYANAKNNEIYPNAFITAIQEAYEAENTGMITTPATNHVPVTIASITETTFTQHDDQENLNWLTGEPLDIETIDDLKVHDHDEQLMWKGTAYHHQVLIPASVTHIHQWGSSIDYVAIDDMGARFIPFNTLKLRGYFY